MFKQITILAPGLLGSSLAMAIKDHGLADKLVIWSRRAETRVKCVKKLICNAVEDNIKDAVCGADLVIICSPVDVIASIAQKTIPCLKEGCIITDVGSTKSLICRNINAVVSRHVTFIGSHPMAGSEKSGIDAADSKLFLGKPCFVTPLVETPESSLEILIKFWSELDMEVITTTPEKHDEIVANISQMPHLLASVLCSYLAAKDSNWKNFAGNGLRDTTRIASGNPELWKTIIEQNSDEILRAINGFENELQSLRSAISNNEPFEILNILERGKKYRDRLRS